MGVTKTGLDDLPGVVDGTAEHHAENHPNGLLKGKQKSIRKYFQDDVSFFNILTHHDSSNPDAHAANDEEFIAEELFNFCLTVLDVGHKSKGKPQHLLWQNDSISKQSSLIQLLL